MQGKNESKIKDKAKHGLSKISHFGYLDRANSVKRREEKREEEKKKKEEGRRKREGKAKVWKLYGILVWKYGNYSTNLYGFV